MPIQDEALDAPWNAHLAVFGQATLRQVFAYLASTEMDTAGWWHLVVAKVDGTWAVGKLADLAAKARADETMLDVPLEELDRLVLARAVSRDSMGTRQAEDEAQRSPGQVLIVTDGGDLAGMLYVGQRKSGEEQAILASVLVELPGELIDLKEFSHMLIKNHTPRRASAGEKERQNGGPKQTD